MSKTRRQHAFREKAFWLFSCSHPNTSFPQTTGTAPDKQTTVVCLDCGRKLEYDWEKMRRGKEVVAR